MNKQLTKILIKRADTTANMQDYNKLQLPRYLK